VSNHYAGVFVCSQVDNPKDICVLCVTDRRFPENVKMPGGMAELVSGGRNETPEETMKREAISETGVQVISSRLVFVEKKVDPKTGDLHQKYFFLAEEVSALPQVGALYRVVEETNPSDGSVEKLICFWLPLREFAFRLFDGQRLAFSAILAELARNEEFCDEFLDLLELFQAPEES
jgi:ADP-ribose pyrophosphatase YjhB (NUDIX family)